MSVSGFRMTGIVATAFFMLLGVPAAAVAHKIHVDVTGDFTFGVTEIRIRITDAGGGPKDGVPVHI